MFTSPRAKMGSMKTTRKILLIWNPQNPKSHVWQSHHQLDMTVPPPPLSSSSLLRFRLGHSQRLSFLCVHNLVFSLFSSA